MPGLDGHPLEVLVRKILRVPEGARGSLQRYERHACAVALPGFRLDNVESRSHGLLGPNPQLRRAHRLAHRHLHGVELMVTGHFLEDGHTVILENDEVAHEIKEAPGVEQTLDQHLQLGHTGVCQSLAGDGAPRLEPLAASRERARARRNTIGHDEHDVGREKRRDLGLVRLELLERGPDGRVLVGRVLELEHRERQAVDEQHHIRPAAVLGLHDAELVDGQTVVIREVVEVDRTRLRAANRTVCVPILDRHAVHEEAVQRAVALDKIRTLRARQLAKGILMRLGG